MVFKISHSCEKGWDWTLESKDGPVCESPDTYVSEAECRSKIAKAKTAMKGARFAKVEVVDGG